MSELSIITALLTALLLSAAVYDYRFYKIPNFISLAGWIAGPIIFTFFFGFEGLWQSLLGLLLVLALTVPFYAFKWMGAGDIKLMGAVGAMVGLQNASCALASIVLTGGVMGIAMMVYRHQLRTFLSRYKVMIGLSMAMRRATYLEPDQNERQAVLPYAVPIAVGGILSMFICEYRF